jgi:hypothetical protein
MPYCVLIASGGHLSCRHRLLQAVEHAASPTSLVWPWAQHAKHIPMGTMGNNTVQHAMLLGTCMHALIIQMCGIVGQLIYIETCMICDKAYKPYSHTYIYQLNMQILSNMGCALHDVHMACALHYMHLFGPGLLVGVAWLCLGRAVDGDGVFGLLEEGLGIARHLFHVERLGEVELGVLVLAQAALEEVCHCA